ncbi:signal peptidase I [Aeromicrobium sp.]|uniref:signal peptidase I n=1 Tax=Aeromicrobium sp. TaxID=1871063 RepID=UPI0028A9CB18|nr:signal peptidase I [Aeromicrobium sp.]
MSRARLGRALAVAGNSVLWVTAVLGAASLLLGLATVVAGVQPLIFRSSSMGPEIPAGALGLAKTVDATEVEVGDVISVDGANGIRVTHRVVEVGEAAGSEVSFTLKGDANAAPDAHAYVASEVDRVFLDIPYLGYVANWMASPWALFVAGIAVAFLAAALFRGSGGTRRRAAGTGAVAIAAAGLAVGSLSPVPTTEAWFTDPATFEAGQMHAHQVRIFDWGSSVCTNDAGGNSVTLRTLVASPRYNQLWFVAPVGQPLPSTPVLRTSPPGALDTPVTTQLTKTMVGGTSAAPGNYQVTGRSELKGSATTPWLSASTRNTTVSITSTGALQCGAVNLPPSITFTAPVNGTTYSSPTAAMAATQSQCGRTAPCGTAADSDGIYRVEYRLQRINFLINRCWDGSGYPIFSGCGTWRTADVSPAVPTSGSTPVKWTVPIGWTSALAEPGNYTLYLRVTGNSSARMVSERTIQFTIN